MSQVDEPPSVDEPPRPDELLPPCTPNVVVPALPRVPAAPLAPGIWPFCPGSSCAPQSGR